MMRRAADGRWERPLGQFVRRFGVRRLCVEFEARGIPITEGAVYNWVAGRSVPRMGHAYTLRVVSGGSLTMEEAFGSVKP